MSQATYISTFSALFQVERKTMRLGKAERREFEYQALAKETCLEDPKNRC